MNEPHKIGLISYFSRGITQTAPTRDIRVGDALMIIKNGEFKDQIEKLRGSTTKEVRQTLKRDLGYFCFSGTFKKRNANALIQHSGIMCIDLDDLDIIPGTEEKDPERVKLIKQELEADQYITAMFVSPSGNGLKILIRINGHHHLSTFKALEKYFRHHYDLELDPSGKDVSRACYVSYDPEIYINDNSTPFYEVEAEDVEINERSGEIVDRAESVDALPPKLKKSYERAMWVCEQIDELQLDICPEYQEWIEVGMALAVFGEAGRELYHHVSQHSDKYNPRDCDNKFTNLIKTTTFKEPSKFFRCAKDAGIETRKTKELEPGAAADAETKRREWEWKSPDGMKLSDDQKEFALNNGFLEIKNSIFMAKHNFKAKSIELDQVSNYVLRPLFLIKSKSDPKRLYEATNNRGAKVVVDMAANSFKTLGNFVDVMECLGNFLIDCTKKDFHTLKTYWFEKEKPSVEITTLGWHKDGFYAFSNGLYSKEERFKGIDEYGVISRKVLNGEGEETDQHYFIPALSDIYKDEEAEYENEKSFIYVPSRVKWTEWSQLFCKVHGENGHIALLFFCASIFRDVVVKQLNSFPLLLGFGKRGTGKSLLGWSMMYLFGKERKPFNLNSGTEPGFFRTLAQFNNAMVWFDELDNKVDSKRLEALKNAFDGAGHTKGDWSAGGNSNRTTTTPVRSACYVSGQELPIINPALFSRTILLEFVKTEFTQAEREVAKQLQDMERPGLSKITGALTLFRDKISENFPEQYEKVLKRLKSYFNEQNITVIERLLSSNAVLLTMYELLRDEIEFPFSDQEIWQTVQSKLYGHSKLFTKSEETNQFWEAVQYLYMLGQITDGSDFCIRYTSKLKVRIDRDNSSTVAFTEPKHILFINLGRLHGLYMESMKKRNEKGMDKASLCQYLEHSRGYVGAVNSVNFGNRKTSGYAFEYEAIQALGINLKQTKGEGGSYEGGADDDVEEYVEAAAFTAKPKKDMMDGKQGDMPF